MLLLQDFVHNAVLDIDSAGICAGKITNQFFVRRRILIRILLKHLQQVHCFFLQA